MALQLPEKRPKYNVVNNFKFCPLFDESLIQEAMNYKPRSDDIFIVTYPKCGTTWMQQVCTLLLRGQSGAMDLNSNPILKVSPFLEGFGSKAVESMTRPFAIKTHLPWHLIPFNSDAKYIYVLRNPKDACVSFYYHIKAIRGYEFDGSFQDFLKCWLQGEVECGDFAQHVLPWWGKRHEKNILIVFYEEMVQDLRSVVVKLAKFLGPEYYDKLDDNLELILENSTFAHMKVTTNKHMETMTRDLKLIDSNTEYHFIRKGIVGDWKNHFNDEDQELFNHWFEKNFKGTDLEYAWDKYE